VADEIVKALAVVKAVDDDSEFGAFELVLSTPTRDRDGEEVLAEEWELPLPVHITMDVDHGMSVVTTVGSGEPTLDDDGRLIVRGTYASTDLAQQTRALVNEGHIRTSSVAFLRKKVKADGKTVTRRELLNGAFVAVPANPEALIMTSKTAAPTAEDVERETKAATTVAIRKAIAGTFEETQAAVQQAVCDLYDDWSTWAYLLGTTDDVAVWRVWSDDEQLRGTWRATYTIDEAFDVTLSEPEKVRVVEVVVEIPDVEGETGTASLASAPAAKAAPDATEPAPSEDRTPAEVKALAAARAHSIGLLGL